MHPKITILLCALFLGTTAFAQSGKKLFSNDKVHEIRWTFDEPNFWEILETNFQSSIDPDNGIPTNVPYLGGTISIDGEVIDSVGLRHKGFSSYFASNDLKKSLKVDFNEFVPGKNFDGIKKFNLTNGVGDPGFQRDMIAYDIMRKAGIRAPRTAHARVYLNDVYWGLYVIIEQVDKTFLQRNFADGNGNLYKAIGWSELEYLGESPDLYRESIGLKTNEDNPDWSDFTNLMKVINQTSQANFKDEIEPIFNVDYFLRVLAVDVMLNNWDSYMEHGRNFYLYHEPSSDKFFWVPWDYNLSMGGNFENGGGGGLIGDPPSDPPNCPTILSGDSPYTANDSIFLQVIDIAPQCCYGEWEGFCDIIYDHLANIGDCNSIQNGSSPYPAEDPIFQQVTLFEPSCCSASWDSDCQELYDNLSDDISNGLRFNDFELTGHNTNKTLITKILRVSEYRERYLNYACHILENNFTSARLSPMIDSTAALIYDAVEDDLNANFPFDDFLYDISEGVDTSRRSIPSLKQFINHRIPLLQAEIDDLNHNCAATLAPIEWHDVVINEFVASNDSTSGIFDQDGEADDWIELHNNTNESIDLTDFFLSDNYDNPLKWDFPAGTTIGPKGYLIVWADENGMEEGLHANFKLRKDGESIMLVHSDGTFIDSLSFGQQETNIPSARIPNGTGDFVKQDPTFNGNNDGSSSTYDLTDGLFKIYPNPTSDIFTISLEEDLIYKNSNLQLVNMLGQIMLSQNIGNSPKVQVDVSHLTAGMYFAVLNFDKQKAVVKVFVE